MTSRTVLVERPAEPATTDEHDFYRLGYTRREQRHSDRTGQRARVQSLKLLESNTSVFDTLPRKRVFARLRVPSREPDRQRSWASGL